MLNRFDQFALDYFSNQCGFMFEDFLVDEGETADEVFPHFQLLSSSDSSPTILVFHIHLKTVPPFLPPSFRTVRPLQSEDDYTHTSTWTCTVPSNFTYIDILDALATDRFLDSDRYLSMVKNAANINVSRNSIEKALLTSQKIELLNGLDTSCEISNQARKAL